MVAENQTMWCRMTLVCERRYPFFWAVIWIRSDAHVCVCERSGGRLQPDSCWAEGFLAGCGFCIEGKWGQNCPAATKPGKLQQSVEISQGGIELSNTRHYQTGSPINTKCNHVCFFFITGILGKSDYLILETPNFSSRMSAGDTVNTTWYSVEVFSSKTCAFGNTLQPRKHPKSLIRWSSVVIKNIAPRWHSTWFLLLLYCFCQLHRLRAY